MNREEAKVWAGLTKEQLKIIGEHGYAKHLDVIRKFAEGAVIEWCHDDAFGWVTSTSDNPQLSFYECGEYRVKKPMRTINGFEVPAPDVNTGTRPMPEKVYSPDLLRVHMASPHRADWASFRLAVERGIAFTDMEDAIANAKAMLGINPYEEE